MNKKIKIRKSKHAQQEIVGFVLIVVLVVIALMVFLVISVRKAPEEKQSIEVENMLSVILDYTTNCAIVYEPDYDKIEDLVKSCYDNRQCTNLDKMACDYLNETVVDLMGDLMKSESVINAYQFDILHRDGGGGEDDRDLEDGILKVAEGNCSGSVVGASVPLVVAGGGGGDLVVRLRICKEI
ncbi:hypothetical protein CL614_07805 [archaeon]|nr:hypothetical protein [archaeon]|tara:strand:+ start:1356 stop:1904 length:549 start_codon:yes stop_codon:yes gene_type:complete